MKNLCTSERPISKIIMLVVGLVTSANVIGQTERTQAPGLYAEHDASHNQVKFPLGKTMVFKTKSQNTFRKARLVGFTDSTLTFAWRRQPAATYHFYEIAKLKTSKLPGRMVAKTAVILTGAALIVIDFGNSFAHDGEGGTMSGFGLVAIAGGIAISGRNSVNLLNHWSLKTVNARALNSNDSSAFASSIESPSNRGFVLGLGLGYGGQVDQSSPSNGFAIYAEPRYMVSKSFGAGLNISYVGESASVISCSLNGRYYLGSGNVRPFLGAGFGFYSVRLGGSNTSTTFQTFGFYPRLGVDFKRINLIVDYNKLPEQTSMVNYYFAGNPGFWAAIPTSKEYSYLTVTLGIAVGKGKMGK